jgi:hypothetical protein
MMSRAVGILVLALAVACGGCSNSPTSATTTPTTSTTPITEVFTGTLTSGTPAFYSFTVVQKSNVFLMLASETQSSTGPTLSIPLNLGLGVPAGVGCGLTQSVTVAPSLTAHIAVTLDPSIYCVNLQDVGNLPAPVNFAVRIVHQ